MNEIIIHNLKYKSALRVCVKIAPAHQHTRQSLCTIECMEESPGSAEQNAG